jgi:hypothetical protein
MEAHRVEMLRFLHFLDSRVIDGDNAAIYPQENSKNSPGTHFCYRLSRPQGHSAAGRIRSIERNPMTSSGLEPATFRLIA